MRLTSPSCRWRRAEHRTLVEGGDPRYNGVKYAYSGHLVLTQDQSLWAVPFDARALEVTGDPVLVQEGVRVSNNRVTQFAIADEGSLVYIPEDFSFTGMPVWVDRTGTVVESFMEEALDTPRYPRLSPDGRRLALVVGPFDAGNIWVQDLTGRPPIKLTFEGNDFSPLWTPDGQQLVFESERTEQGSGMYVTPIDGSMADTQRLPVEGHSHPFAFTPDGRELLFVTFNDQRAGSDIWALSMNGNPESRPVVQTEHREGADGASVSSDGRWLAYVSRVTGRSEVWVRPYLEPGAPVRISPDGGIEPIWGRDDREIVYVENLGGPKMMAVAVETEPEFRFEPPARLFEWAAPPEVQPPSYDVGPDGNFLMIRREQDATVLNRIIVVQNWFDELQRLVPSP